MKIVSGRKQEIKLIKGYGPRKSSSPPRDCRSFSGRGLMCLSFLVPASYLQIVLEGTLFMCKLILKISHQIIDLIYFHNLLTSWHAGILQLLLQKIWSSLQALDCPSQTSELIKPVKKKPSDD